jgi:large subunit ribosomal protein L19
MAITAQHKEVTFGVGDKVKVVQRIKEGEKARSQSFEGIVLGIKGSNENTSFTVRRIGEANIGIERIFPLYSPTIEKVEVTRKGGEGIRRAKIYYIRGKSKKQIEKIFSRTANKNIISKPKRKKAPRKTKAKK